mmetsp:Transcript_11348/g.30677  ORF Transcript_11348/g.30677 Transcript_11348/m.30677 type:complete len:225 (-) Transcript_11348:471-1145(-)
MSEVQQTPQLGPFGEVEHLDRAVPEGTHVRKRAQDRPELTVRSRRLEQAQHLELARELPDIDRLLEHGLVPLAVPQRRVACSHLTPVLECGVGPRILHTCVAQLAPQHAAHKAPHSERPVPHAAHDASDGFSGVVNDPSSHHEALDGYNPEEVKEQPPRADILAPDAHWIHNQSPVGRHIARSRVHHHLRHKPSAHGRVEVRERVPEGQVGPPGEHELQRHLAY